LRFPTKSHLFSSAFLLLVAGASLPVPAQDEKRCTHVYQDEKGNSVCAAGWKQIPERFRSTAQPVGSQWVDPDEYGILLSSDEELRERTPVSTIYRYRNESGRESYTNIWDQVPTASREKAEVVDLSGVSLNTEIGREIDASLEKERDALLGSEYCRAALQHEKERWWLGLWSNFKPLIVVAAVIILLLLATPFALRKVDAPQWSRTLTMAIQVLTLLGLFVFAVTKMADGFRVVRAMAAPCRTDSWEKAASEPDALARRANLLQQLQRRIEHFEQKGMIRLGNGRGRQ